MFNFVRATENEGQFISAGEMVEILENVFIKADVLINISLIGDD
ncbi:MAG: hypothetical protein ACPKOI_04605 [Pleomorphochaeta sp.]